MFLNIDEVASLRNVTPKTACADIRKINGRFNVTETKFVSLKAYCEFYYLDEATIEELL